MYDPSFLKSNADMISGMSDEQLKEAAKRASSMYGMSEGQFSPEMMRQSSEMFKNMSDTQINDYMKMAQSMGMGRPGGMPGGMPNFNNPYASSPSYTQPQSQPKSEIKFKNDEEKKKYESVNNDKNKANDLFKNGEYKKASDKYYEVINTIRTTEFLKKSSQGAELETVSRLNLALCKIKQEEYDVAVDQWERILLTDGNNVKALYRISVALDELKKPLEAWTYIKKAYSINKSDSAISELYEKIKVIKDEHTRQLLGNKKEESRKEDIDSSDDEQTKARKSGFKFSNSNEEKADKPKVEEEEEKIQTEPQK